MEIVADHLLEQGTHRDLTYGRRPRHAWNEIGTTDSNTFMDKHVSHFRQVFGVKTYAFRSMSQDAVQRGQTQDETCERPACDVRAGALQTKWAGLERNLPNGTRMRGGFSSAGKPKP